MATPSPLSLDKIQALLKTGKERLLSNGQELPYSLLDFWRWSVSDLMSNATRGRLAEFIVATAMGIDTTIVRDEWSAYDLETIDGIKIEVKSCAYLQSWYQKALSTISFSIRPAFTWDSNTNLVSKIATRSADVYVFCLLHHTNKQTVEVLNLDHWEFYVLATSHLDAYTRSRHSITLKSLAKLTQAVSYQQLNNEVKMQAQNKTK